MILRLLQDGLRTLLLSSPMLFEIRKHVSQCRAEESTRNNKGSDLKGQKASLWNMGLIKFHYLFPILSQ